MHAGVEEPIRFQVDDLTLEGAWAGSAASPQAVVLCHPHPHYGGDMDNDVIRAVATALRAAGSATLRFNFRGVGASEGAHDAGVGERADARAAVAWAQRRAPGAAITLAGYSFGAIVALAAAGETATVGRVVAIGPPVALVGTGALDRCPRPVLVVVGERDAYCPRADVAAACAASAAARIVVAVPGADHFFAGCAAAAATPVVAFVTGPR